MDVQPLGQELCTAQLETFPATPPGMLPFAFVVPRLALRCRHGVSVGFAPAILLPGRLVVCRDCRAVLGNLAGRDFTMAFPAPAVVLFAHLRRDEITTRDAVGLFGCWHGLVLNYW